MEYHIRLENGTTIASFLNESDRDYCIDTLRDVYPDSVFDAVNGE